MRIGIDALFYASGGSLTNLVQILDDWQGMGVFEEHQVFLLTARANLPKLNPEVLARMQVIAFDRCDGGLAGRLWDEQIELVRKLALLRLDVLYCPANSMPFLAKVPCVTTFQNAAPFCPTLGRTGLKNSIRLAALGFMMRMSARRASRVIFISQFFFELFKKRFSFPKPKGKVIYRACPKENGSGRHDESSGYGFSGPYFLSVSHLNPYKNLSQLIEGFSLAVPEIADPLLKLVIVGGEYLFGCKKGLMDLVKTHGLSDRVVFLGEIPHRDVQRLISGCEAFVFSSTCENCPTALMEALSARVPIGCSDVGVMPEIAGDAALYFDPFDPQSIAEVLVSLHREPELRSKLVSKTAEQMKKFPGRAEVAIQTLSVIKEAALSDYGHALQTAIGRSCGS